jgi:ubiquinone/menaquinone biosynthesis C-methylase UbiE
MDLDRKPFQGVLNIIRFNSWKYIFSFFLLLVMCCLYLNSNSLYQSIWLILILVLAFFLSISLLISYIVYDYSALYQLPWLPNLEKQNVLNVNAGFDEISDFLKEKYPEITLIKSDFFDSERHTEPSIQRARKIYPPQSDVVLINTEKIDFESNMFDSILLFFAAHEVRNEQERIAFFKELSRVLKPEGKIYITEHLRNWVNFIPYSVGFFHFYSKKSWSKIVHSSDFKIEKEIKTTPFVSTFILTKNGN